MGVLCVRLVVELCCSAHGVVDEAWRVKRLWMPHAPRGANRCVCVTVMRCAKAVAAARDRSSTSTCRAVLRMHTRTWIPCVPVCSQKLLT